MKYRTKPVEVEAVQFNKLGDHPSVVEGWRLPLGEVRVKLPEGFSENSCTKVFCLDGVFGTSEVNLSDYIVTDRNGTCVKRPVAFESLYEKVEEPKSGLYQCSSCGTIGDWPSWLSGAFQGVHHCDCCYTAGKQHMLIPHKQD